MSDTDDILAWYLTADGWVVGASVMYPDRMERGDEPPGTVEIWKVEYNMDSQYGTPVSVVAHGWWQDNSLDEEARHKLWQRHPPPWRDYGSWYLEKPKPPA